jgi:hypothetical protein
MTLQKRRQAFGMSNRALLTRHLFYRLIVVLVASLFLLFGILGIVGLVLAYNWITRHVLIPSYFAQEEALRVVLEAHRGGEEPLLASQATTLLHELGRPRHSGISARKRRFRSYPPHGWCDTLLDVSDLMSGAAHRLAPPKTPSDMGSPASATGPFLS